MISHMTRVVVHLDKARTKHPFFSTRVTGAAESFVKKTLSYYRKRNDSLGDRVDAYSLAEEELYEALAAYKAGDYKGAVDELYDAVAVLLRTAELISAEAEGKGVRV